MAKAENGKKDKAETDKKEPAEDTVRMKAPIGHGASGIPVGDQVIQVVPDKKGYVDAPKSCVGTLRGLGYQIIVHEADETE